MSGTAEYQMERYWLHRNLGICTKCPEAAVEGLSLCVACRADQNARMRRRRPAPTRLYCCRGCGQTGHNRRTCPESEAAE